ncbi:DUF6252 family protein [Desertivirga brevis]|uniref:DUF6252 family protein n=1 Tax=Desertivirga brevis TaxID=2810310 RepID=UPI001A95DFCA|nr:DUF6252 family protein [Pedobacter sp. SYSU D00873]
MKKITSILLTISLVALGFSSCKKDDAEKVDDLEDIKSTKMSWKFDGTAKTSTTLFAHKDEGDLTVIGGINETETLTLYISEFHGTGDYNVDDEENSIHYVTAAGISNPAALFAAKDGVIKITSSTNGEVKGTFSGTLENALDQTKPMTEGKFEAKIVTGSNFD